MNDQHDRASSEKTRAGTTANGLKPDWSLELAEVQSRVVLAQQMGGEERVARQHAAGRLTMDIIDPRDTRPLLVEWAHLAARLQATQLGPPHEDCGHKLPRKDPKL